MEQPPPTPDRLTPQNAPAFNGTGGYFMAESHVVTGLVEKRREIAGVIEHHRKEMERLAGDLAHVDATIRLFAPELDLRTLRPKEHRERNAFFRPGEAPRFILDSLREAATPLTCRALGERAVAALGLDAGAEVLEALQKSLNGAIKTLVGRGTLVEGPRAGSSRTWCIA